ncbi:MAG TPA: putative sugar nucleotidyl transferase [Puia sp.]|nr:putative sugar nucleotidyl transferase [Puia sp.]
MKPVTIHLADGPYTDDFYPFSLTRSIADIRCGILTLREKWNYLFTDPGNGDNELTIPSNLLPNQQLHKAIQRSDRDGIDEAIGRSTRLHNSLDILSLNDAELRSDFELLTTGRTSAPISPTNQVIGAKNGNTAQIFLEPGAKVEFAVLNVTNGPIYIGKNAEVMEGCLIRGPFALGEGAVVKMGARIYGATTVGPFCVVGGEIKHAILFGYSNKAHDGYLGDSVIGEWCNLGAGTSNSNVKNTAGNIFLPIPRKNILIDAGTKCGVFMGDYSRSAINTSFNTGTLIGACVNVFGKGLTPSYLSSFTWGFDLPERYDFEKAMQHIRQWKQFRNKTMGEEEIARLKAIYDKEKSIN